MRTLLRVGGIAGLLAGALASALAPRAGIAVAALVALAGLAAGLATAKWLPPAWYGRQFGAGLRAGVIACVIAVPATLVALLDFAPPASPRLTLGAAPLALAADLLGSGIAAALAVALAALAAMVLAAFSARIVAADKSARFVKAVSRAREASQPLHEEGLLAPAFVRHTAVPLAAAGGGAVATWADRPAPASPAEPRVAPQRRTLVPATPPEGIAGTGGTSASRRAVDAPARRAAAAAMPAPLAEPDPERAPAPAPAPPPAAPFAPKADTAAAAAPAAPALKRRGGGGRPPAARLTPQMIEALAAWARDTEEDEGDTDESDGENGAEAVAAGRAAKDGRAEAARQPVESTYLNTPAPAPKRKRKKNATRDWIC